MTVPTTLKRPHSLSVATDGTVTASFTKAANANTRALGPGSVLTARPTVKPLASGASAAGGNRHDHYSSLTQNSKQQRRLANQYHECRRIVTVYAVLIALLVTSMLLLTIVETWVPDGTHSESELFAIVMETVWRFIELGIVIHTTMLIKS